MIEQSDKDFIAEAFAKERIDWDNIDAHNGKEFKRLSNFIYSLERDYGYETTDVVLVIIDRVYNDVQNLLSELDADIVESVMEYARGLRKETPGSELERYML